MKKVLMAAVVSTALFISLVGCATTDAIGEWEPEPTNRVTRSLQEAQTVAVLGYNTSRGLDDRLLNNAIDSSFGLSISVEEKPGDKFPVGDRVNRYDETFRRLLREEGPYELIAKDAVVSSSAYQEIVGDPSDEMLSNVNAAENYTLTYQFATFMDNQDDVPMSGELVNRYKATLEELGADLGIIVVEKPYVRVQNYALIPDELFNGKEDYFAVAGQTTFYIIRPAAGNQVIFAPTFLDQSDQRYMTDDYTEAQRQEDQNSFLSQYDAVSASNQERFVRWLTTEVTAE